MSSELNDIIDILAEQGFRYIPCSNGHRVYGKDGKSIVFIGKSFHDHRAVKNMKSDLKKIGVRFDDEFQVKRKEKVEMAKVEMIMPEPAPNISNMEQARIKLQAAINALSDLEVALNGLEKDLKRVETFKALMKQMQE